MCDIIMIFKPPYKMVEKVTELLMYGVLFSTLKKDIIYGRRFKTREEAELVIIEYTEAFYNCPRLHSTLGNLSPMEYERQYSYREEVAQQWLLK